MRVIVYPADSYGCGHHRLIWPSQILQEQGHDVTIVTAQDRRMQLYFDTQDKMRLVKVEVPEGTDVVVFQRTTDSRVVQAVRWLREHGVSVVIDVDDDLSAIHPANPAWTFLDPNRAEREVRDMLSHHKVKQEHAAVALQALRNQYTHSWNNMLQSCKDASLVTVSTPGLLKRYAGHGRGMVLNNYAPEHYFGFDRQDSDLIGWPAALMSHPNDPDAAGNSIARLVAEGCRFTSIGADNGGVRKAFGLPREPEFHDDVPLMEWPRALAELGIGIVPLADTRFNAAKSHLKGLEMSAVGVPWVASPRAEYVKLSAMGAGLLAEKPRDWYRKLRALVDEPGQRADVAAAGRSVADQLRLKDNAWRWFDAWEQAYNLDHGLLSVAGG